MSKTSNLTPLETGLVGNDLLQVVDVSDTSMTGGGGTNKKITITNFATGLISVGGIQPLIEAGSTNQYYAGDKSWKTLNKAAVELSNVTNESKATMFTSPVFTQSATLPANTTIGDVTAVELSHLEGVTGSIQGQLNNKQDTIVGAAESITDADLTSNIVLISNNDGKVASSSITSTELGYLDGLNTNVQNQLNALKYSSVEISTSTLTLGTTHISKYIRCNNITRTDITVPRQLTVAWPEESIIYFRRVNGAGPIYLIADTSVVINGAIFAPTILENQNFALKRVSQNVWDFI